MGEPHSGDFGLRERFNSTRLPLAWVSLGPPDTQWWRSGGGSLRMDARPGPLGGKGQPSMLGIRQQHSDFEAQVTVAHVPGEVGARTGLAAYQGRRRSLALAVATLPGDAREVRLDRVGDTNDPADGVLVTRAPLPSHGRVRLQIRARGRDHFFAYAIGEGPWRALGDVQDGTLLSVRGSRGFTGVLLGAFATAPTASPPKS